MTTTTIRVDTETHEALQTMAAANGASLVDTVRAATEALRRQRFAADVSEKVEALRADPDAWASYIDDADSTHVTDGID